MITDRINFDDMPEFVGDIEDILLEANIGDKSGNVVLLDDELEELAETYNSVGEFLDDLENLYMRTLFDKFENFLKEQFGEEVKVDYLVNCRDSHLTMQTPNEDIEFEDKNDYKRFCEIMGAYELSKKTLTDYDKDYPKAIKALKILANSEDEETIIDIFTWLQKSYDENIELFEPQNAYADLIAVNDFSYNNVQPALAIQKLRIFIANSVESEYKTTDDAGILSEEVLECLENETTQGKFLKGYYVSGSDRIDFLNQIDNGEYLNLEEVKTTSTTKVPLPNKRR